MKRTRRRTAWAWLVLAFVALVTAGCADLEIGIVLEEDGSGVLTTQITFNRPLLEQLSAGDLTAEELLAEAGIDRDALPPGAGVELIDTEELVGARLTLPFEASDDPAAAIDQAFAAIDEPGNNVIGAGGPFEAFTLFRDGENRWVFRAQTAPTDEADGLSALLLGDASLIVHLSLPGEVIEHDADLLEDGVLTWELPLAGEARALNATSTAESERFGIPLVIAFVLVAVTLAAALALVAMRRRG